MTAAHQMEMFEPQGDKLAELVRVHFGNYSQSIKQAENLSVAGFLTTARSRWVHASVALENAFVCESALQFEKLAGLS